MATRVDRLTIMFKSVFSRGGSCLAFVAAFLTMATTMSFSTSRNNDTIRRRDPCRSSRQFGRDSLYYPFKIERVSTFQFQLYLSNFPRDGDDVTEDVNDNDGIMEQVKEVHATYEVERTRSSLEEANKQAFLRRRPVKLTYEQARTWVQANLGVDTREEFMDLVENGNLRTPYIPKNPESWYQESNDWISWDHFLHGITDDKRPSGIRPPSGAFD